VGARHPDGKDAAGEGHRVGEGQRWAGSAVDAPAEVTCVQQWGMENVAVFFFWRNRVILKVGRRRSIGPDHWTGLGTSRPDGTRQDGHRVPVLSFMKASLHEPEVGIL
jgi:hypothetical protein